MKIFQKGFNYSQDGPGNRLVYHISGCNMKCLWCANPEGINIDTNHKDYTANDILKEAISCKPMFFDGGGVTFTGGEATLYCDGLIEVLKLLKQNDIHTCIETNGTSKRLDEILPYVDYLIMDFKHYDSNVLKKYTGCDGNIIKSNFKKICDTKRQCHIRIPLVNEFNGSCYTEFALYLSAFDTTNVVFEFLKYHEYGREKWTEEYKITDGYVTDDTVLNYINEFKKYNLKVIKS